MAHEYRLADAEEPTVPHARLLRAFDYLAAAAFGAAGAVVAWLVVPAALPAILEMLLGMLAGMIAALPLLAIFSWLLGGFEIVVVSLQAGMLAGMVGSMTSSTALGDVAFEGMLVGLIVQLLLHGVDRAMGGEVTRGG